MACKVLRCHPNILNIPFFIGNKFVRNNNNKWATQEEKNPVCYPQTVVPQVTFSSNL